MALGTTGISTSLVATTLGAGTNDVGSLCVHQKVNKWSKWKPIRNLSVGGISQSEIRAAKGGLQLPTFFTETALMSAYRGTPAQLWEYLKPRGNSVNPIEPYRLGDFRNYEHSAERFFHVAIPDRVFANDTPKIALALDMNNNPNWLDWNDLILENYYFGAIAVRQGNSTPYEKSISLQTLLDMSEFPYVEVSIPSPELGVAYEIFTFLSTGINAPMISLEYGYGIVNYIGVADVYLTAMWDNTFTRLNWELSLTNNTGLPITINNAVLYARYGDMAITDPMQVGEYRHNLSSPLTVPVGGLTLSGYWDNILPNYNTRSGYVYFENSNFTNLNKVFYIEEPVEEPE